MQLEILNNCLLTRGTLMTFKSIKSHNLLERAKSSLLSVGEIEAELDGNVDNNSNSKSSKSSINCADVTCTINAYSVFAGLKLP